ncbi:MAG: hypothetical protein A3J75_01305 [Acidobacteria bacterium RBG_16_68_9]|nr:MAG: hypothetical protein A3J75_01305 [Acidobacteria bacterium RBG_16_68_9]
MQEPVLRPIAADTPQGVAPTAAGADVKSVLDDPLDDEVLAMLRELPGEEDDSLLNELIDLYVHDVPPRLDEIRRAVGAGDAKTVTFVAHSLKGSSANIGAPHMADLCSQLEQQGRAGSLEGAEALHGEIEREFHHVCRALDVERQRDANGNGR